MTAADTELLAAARAGDVHAVQRLLDAGAAIDGPGRATPPLVAAAQGGHPAVVALLLERGADPNATGGYDTAALHLVKDPATVRHLVAAGADLGQRAAGGRTPLHMAAANADAKTIQALLAAGADPDAAMDEWEQRPLHVAARLRKGASLKALLATPPAAGLIAHAVAEVIGVPRGNPLKPKEAKALQAMLAVRPDLDGELPNGWRLVHLVAERANGEVMAQVLAAGADPDGRGPGDLTAAFLAAARGARSDLPRAVGVIEALRAAGADLDVVCTADPTGQHSGRTARQILNELGVLPG